MTRRHAFELLRAVMAALLLLTLASVVRDGAFTGFLFVAAVVAGVGMVNVMAKPPLRPRWRPRIRRTAVR